MNVYVLKYLLRVNDLINIKHNKQEEINLILAIKLFLYEQST